MKDPFEASSKERITPEGNLFAKQIHRSDLKAIEIIGAGQFGAVYLATQRMLVCPMTGRRFAIGGHLKRHMELVQKKTKQTPPDGWTLEKVREGSPCVWWEGLWAWSLCPARGG